MTNDERMHAARELVLGLSREEQLLLVQDLLADIRWKHFTDHEARMREHAADIQAILAYEAAQRAAQSQPEPVRAAG